jgi:cell division inhibitor SepF
MGFFDSIRERFGGSNDDYYDDDYDDGYDDYDDSYANEPRPRSNHAPTSQPESNGLLGVPSRPKAESVSVYTRSGEFVDSNYEGTDVSAPLPQDRNMQVTQNEAWTDSRLDYVPGASDSMPGRGASSLSPSATTQIPRSGKLPPYVLSPIAYDDVQMVIRRVRTNQPVVLDFHGTKIDTAKRILDFCFGFGVGINGSVQELGDRVFVVLPAGISLSQGEIDKLQRDGVLRG